MNIREDLKAYLDGELDAQRAAEVRDAIEADPTLRQEVEFMKLLSKKIKESSKEPEPKGLDAVLQNVAPQKRKPRFFRWVWVTSGALGMLLVLGLVGESLRGGLFSEKSDAASDSKALGTTERMLSDSALSPSAVPGRSKSAPSEAVVKSKAEPSAASAEAEGSTFRSSGRSEAKRQAPPLAGPSINPPSPTPFPTQSDNRMVVKNADLAVKVEDARKAQAEASNMVQGLGGFVESSSSQDPTGEQPTTYVVLRVPSRNFDAAMGRLRSMGEVLSESITGEDVTSEYVDVEARLRALREELEQYRLIMKSAKRIGDVIQIRDRMSEVRQEIASLEAQKKSLSNQSALSTISASFQQKTRIQLSREPGSWSEEAWATAVNGLTTMLRLLATGLIYLFVLAPIWAPIALGVWWFYKKYMRTL